MNNPSNVDLSEPEHHQEIAAHIISILKAIRYGSIEIVVHDGRVVQIDRHEKFRVKAGQNKH